MQVILCASNTMCYILLLKDLNPILSDDETTQRLVRNRGGWEKVKENNFKTFHLKIRFADICTRVPVSDPFLRRRKRDAEVKGCVITNGGIFD